MLRLLAILLFSSQQFDILYNLHEQAVENQNYALSARYLEDAISEIHPDSLLCYSDTYNGLTSAYFHLDNFEKALEYGKKALEIDEKLKVPENISQSYTFLAAIFAKMQMWHDAEEYQLKSLTIEQNLNRERTYAARLAVLGEIYVAQDKYQDALKVTQKALDIDNEANRHEIVAIRKSQLGNVYMRMGDKDKALLCFQESVDSLRYYNQNSSLCITLLQLAEVQSSTGKYQQAEASLNECLNVSSQIGQRRSIQQAYWQLAQLYKTYNPQKATDYYILAASLRDTLYNETISKQISEFKVQFETKEIEQKNTILQHTIQRQQLIIIICISLIVFALFVFLLVRRVRNLRKNIEDTEAKAVEIIQQSTTNVDIPLSEREMDVVRACCQGKLSKEIADQLYISKRTVDNHKTAIYQKLGVKNNTELIIYAVKHNLIEI